VTTIESAISQALADGDETQAVSLLRHAFAAPAASLPELLEELAEYYAAQGRVEDAVGAMGRALDAGWDGRPDARCRMAEYLLRAGLPGEAEELYEAARDDHPDDLDVYHAAGVDYAEAGRPERAVAWLTAGLERALALGVGAHCGVVCDMVQVRRECLMALERALDALDARVDAAVRAHREQPDEPAMFAMPWLPTTAYEAARDEWPGFAAAEGGRDHGAYSRAVDAQLAALAAVSPQRRLAVAPVELDELTDWCTARGLDAGEPACREAYAAALAQAGRVRAWPPQGACWCGSGHAHADCCASG
jgi:tetratricopeptide (TPR) repeat protein